jgi:hypothetical protein
MADVEEEPSAGYARHLAQDAKASRAIEVKEEPDREHGVEGTVSQRNRVGGALEDRELLAELSESLAEHLVRDIRSRGGDVPGEEEWRESPRSAGKIQSRTHLSAETRRRVERPADGGEVAAIAPAPPRRLVAPGVVAFGDGGVAVTGLGALERLVVGPGALERLRDHARIL